MRDSVSNKTAAGMLRELREGMTAVPWRVAGDSEEMLPYLKGCSGDELMTGAVLESNDARGIVALVNSLEEIAALVDLADDAKAFVNWGGNQDLEDRLHTALDALTEKLREQLKGAGDE